METKEKVTHIPTPSMTEQDLRILIKHYTPETSAFIVTAVNSHEANEQKIASLLGYVKDLLELERARMSSNGLRHYPTPAFEYIVGIENAIASAEAK